MHFIRGLSGRARFLIVLVAGAATLIGVFLFIILAPQDAGIKSATDDALPADVRELSIEAGELEHVFTSPEMEAKFEFNAIAPLWEVEGEGADHQHIEMRTAERPGEWTEWMVLEASTAQRDDKVSSRYFPETPLFIEGKYFQYRLKLERESADQTSPKITDIKVNYIDSRQTITQQVSSALKGLFAKVSAGNSPYVISRGEWGSPDPHNTNFKGTDKYWAPSYYPTKQVFLHHTVSPNVHGDPKAIIRGIWDYHANTLGWGDIGYNYVVDFKGYIYEGRHGGDYVTGGHTLHYNQGSLGVAVLGCFQPNSATCNQLNGGNTTAPTSATIDGLTTLLSWKTSLFGINPDVTQTFCQYNDSSDCISVPTIAAHRQANDTECNGELFYDMLNQIRQKVVEKNSQNLWGVTDVEFMQKSNFGGTQQLFYGTDSKLYASFWGQGYSGVTKQIIMEAPFRERFVDVYKMTEPDTTTQTIYAATNVAVYKITLTGGDTFSQPTKIVSRLNIKKVFADVREESETTHRLYVLAEDGPYEYWWRSGPVSAGSLLWNINSPLDFVKTRDPSDNDEIYVATKSEVYRVKWPVGGGVERQTMTNIPGTTDVEKQNIGMTELLYTATTSGVHETWWKPGSGFSTPVKIIQTGREVVDIEKTITNDYQQLYVAQPGSVHEFWWGPGVSSIQGGRLIHIPQNTIVEIDKSTTGSYQNLYTASQSFLYETWWGNGRFGNGPAIIDTK